MAKSPPKGSTSECYHIGLFQYMDFGGHKHSAYCTFYFEIDLTFVEKLQIQYKEHLFPLNWE